jgi:hypothetical protein
MHIDCHVTLDTCFPATKAAMLPGFGALLGLPSVAGSNALARAVQTTDTPPRLPSLKSTSAAAAAEPRGVQLPPPMLEDSGEDAPAVVKSATLDVDGLPASNIQQLQVSWRVGRQAKRCMPGVSVMHWPAWRLVTTLVGRCLDPCQPGALGSNGCAGR